MLFLLDKISFTHATADIQLIGGLHKLDENSTGHLQPNGDFIFYVDKDESDKRKLVLTSNDGVRIKGGELSLPASGWRDSSTWSDVPFITVTNFIG